LKRFHSIISAGFQVFGALIIASAVSAAAPNATTKRMKPEPALTPGGLWRAHDMTRPRPAVVTPPAAGEPAPVPPDATVLFDGRELSHWTARLSRGPDKGKAVPPQWKIENGYMEAVPNGGTLICTERFGDCQLHVEWATPSQIKGTGQAFTLALQDHLNPVRFRNVWLRKLSGGGAPAKDAAAKFPVPVEASGPGAIPR
jgi:hypothetical protein